MQKKSFYKPVEDPALRYLKAFQSQRLQDTYADFTAQKEYQAACFFFFNRLYSTDDTTDRDAAFRSIHNVTRRFLGGEVVQSMNKLIELQELTIVLDQKIIEVLRDLERPLDYTMETYERAYKLSDNYQGRIRQIELLEFVNRLIHRISHRFGIGMVLKGLHGACVIYGDTRMADFLMDGYKAFRDMPSIEPLAGAIVTRETERLDRIWQTY
jgi:hypothetical protein